MCSRPCATTRPDSAAARRGGAPTGSAWRDAAPDADRHTVQPPVALGSLLMERGEVGFHDMVSGLNTPLVIHELATNAVKYALGERDTAQITFQVAFDGGMVCCEFRDDGPGYSEDVLQLERYNVGFDLIQNIVRDSLYGELALHNDDGAVAIFQFKTRITEYAIRNTQRRDPR